jgi:molybdate transport system substrate-binding protein
MTGSRRLRLPVFSLALMFLLAAVPARAETVLLFAAASTTHAIEDMIRAYEAGHGDRIKVVFAASSTLARQIANGAPADIFLSANVQWVDYLEDRGAIAAESRVNLLGNRLVLVAPLDAVPIVDIRPGTDFTSLLGDGRLVIGDPGHVPAGLYAKAALESLGAWSGLAGRLAYAGNVRAALALVERGEAAAGIVYATDARISAGVEIVGEFPAELIPAIAYPLALTRAEPSPAARRFYDFLRSADAQRLFEQHGFIAPAAGR